VNLFSGRVKDGAMVISGTEFATPDAEGEQESEAVAFVRPHDVHITREPGGLKTFPARIVHCNAAGPVASLELERVQGGGQFSAVMSKEEFQLLQPRPGEQVFVELKNVKVFSDDYSI
jgi:sulfate transport system ATP-binding protein